MRILYISSVVIVLNLYNSQALECYECGFVPTLSESGSSESCFSPYSGHPTCNYDLNKGNFTDLLSLIKGESTSELTAVCYYLRGTFREEEILMRGCDGMRSEDSNKCFGDEINVWFDTERGREFVTGKQFCMCDGDLCNEQTPGIASKEIVSVILVILSIVVSISMY